jgi:hypothetical protein
MKAVLRQKGAGIMLQTWSQSGWNAYDSCIVVTRSMRIFLTNTYANYVKPFFNSIFDYNFFTAAKVSRMPYNYRHGPRKEWDALPSYSQHTIYGAWVGHETQFKYVNAWHSLPRDIHYEIQRSSLVASAQKISRKRIDYENAEMDYKCNFTGYAFIVKSFYQPPRPDCTGFRADSWNPWCLTLFITSDRYKE